jgi:hypothetical protein
VPLAGDADVVELDFTFQACDAQSCLMPSTVRLVCQVA